MIRGTTAQFKFKLPYSYEELTNITIMFWQPGNPNYLLPILKYKSHCEKLTDNEICVSLRPSETALFSDKYKAKMQLAGRPKLGNTFGTKEKILVVDPMPDDMIMDDPTISPDQTTAGSWMIFDGGEIIVE